MRARSFRRAGFTLLELLVVIVIIAILAGLLVPAFRYAQQMSRAAACASNLRQIDVALNLYLAEHNAVMPPTMQASRASTSVNVPVIDDTLNQYAPDPRVFICPADNLGVGSSTGTSYYWNSALDGQSVASLHFLTIYTLSNIPLLSDKQGFHPYVQNKVNMLYADGHATQDLTFFSAP